LPWTAAEQQTEIELASQLLKTSTFVFDMDGTLVDNAGVHSQIWLGLLAELGVHVSSEELRRRTSGKTNVQILREMLGTGVSDGVIHDLAERKETRYRAIYGPRLKPIKGLGCFLSEVRRLGLSMAVATAADRTNIGFVLSGLRIGAFFDVIVGSEDVTEGKPNPEAFLTAARRLGVAPTHCLVFEDSLAGLEAADRAGMRAVAVATTVDIRELQDLPAVVRVIEDYAALDPRSLLDSVADK
jgi:beta-phosphoglucomutase